MELEQVKSKIQRISKEKNIDIQTTWDTFFFDEFIFRLSNSNYKDNFIFKGGFYLQNILGIETRTTMDIDFKYYGRQTSNKELEEIITDIITTNGINDIKLRLIDINNIRADIKYGGKTIKLEAKYYNIKKDLVLILELVMLSLQNQLIICIQLLSQIKNSMF